MNDIFNVNSYDQRGGVTAAIVNIGNPPREINDKIRQQINDILSHLHVEVKDKINVVTPIFDDEALNCALQIEDYLKTKGYTNIHSRMVSCIPPIPRGQRCRYNKKNRELTFEIGKL